MKLSIIMPFYNSENTIRSALLSINNQSVLNKSNCPEIDLILLDNNSTDNSPQVCRDTLSLFNKKINTHLLKCTIPGVTAARNAALYRAFSLNFDYLASLDSDDEWSFDKLEKQISYLENNKFCDIIGTQIYYINSENRIINKSDYPIENYQIKQCIRSGINPIANSSTLVKRDVFIKCGSYDPSYNLCEDFHLWIKASQWFNFYNLNEYLTNYRYIRHNNDYVPDVGIICSKNFFDCIERFHKK